MSWHRIYLVYTVKKYKLWSELTKNEIWIQIYKSDDILDNTYSVSHVKTSPFSKKKKIIWLFLSDVADLASKMQVSKCLRNQNKCPPQRAEDAECSQHRFKGGFGGLFCLASETHLKWVETKGFMEQRRTANSARFTTNVEKDIDFTVLWYKWKCLKTLHCIFLSPFSCVPVVSVGIQKERVKTHTFNPQEPRSVQNLALCLLSHALTGFSQHKHANTKA